MSDEPVGRGLEDWTRRANSEILSRFWKPATASMPGRAVSDGPRRAILLFLQCVETRRSGVAALKHTPDEQNDDRADDRADQADAILGAGKCQRVADELRGEGADDPEYCGQHEARGLVRAGRDEFCDDACKKANDDRHEDGHV